MMVFNKGKHSWTTAARSLTARIRALRVVPKWSFGYASEGGAAVDGRKGTPKRVVEVIRGLGLGGAETLLHLRLMNSHNAKERSVDGVVVVNTAPTESFYDQPLRDLGVPVVDSISSNSLLGGVDLVRRCRGLMDGTVLVVHSPGPALFLKLGRLFKLINAPIIQVAHSARSRPVYRLAGALTNWISDGCIAVSQEVERSASCVGFRRLTTVYGGVDAHNMATFLQENPTHRRDLRASLGIPDDATLLCSVGTLTANKGHADLVTAFGRADAAAHLVIVGDGPERDHLLSLIDSLGVTDRVHTIGRYAPAWHWMAASDVLYHTSHVEGLPVVLMEALTLGLPVVATAFSGASEAASRASGRVTIVPVGDINAIAEIIRMAVPLHDPAATQVAALQNTYWSVERFNIEFTEAVLAFSRT